jgi:SAM-dependent methyltransferase
VPVTKSSRAIALVYTVGVPREKVVDQTQSYYRKILPFYEKESVVQAHLSFWRGLARRWRPRCILEVGAGLGRITSALAREAPSVGVDVCLEMLSEAARRRGGVAGARFVVADMRRVNFGSAFDLIVAPGDPFSHLTRIADRRSALAAVRRQLAPGGRFVLEGLYRRRREMLKPSRDVRHAGGVLRIAEAWVPVGAGDLWHARYRYRDRRRGEPDRTIEAAMVARSWDPGAIRPLFSACGLTIEQMWGGFDRRPFRRTASRLVAVARRAEDPPRG